MPPRDDMERLGIPADVVTKILREHSQEIAAKLRRHRDKVFSQNYLNSGYSSWPDIDAMDEMIELVYPWKEQE